ISSASSVPSFRVVDRRSRQLTLVLPCRRFPGRRQPQSTPVITGTGPRSTRGVSGAALDSEGENPRGLIVLIQDLTSPASLELLASTRLGRLACTQGAQPYVVPVHFAYHDRALYGFATVGQKIEWMRANPLVCV